MPNKVKKTARKPRGSQASRGTRRREPGRTTISAKNQITIPVAALRDAGFAPGTRLEVSAVSGGEIVLRSADETAGDRIRRLAGGFEDCYPPGYLEDLRKDWN